MNRLAGRVFVITGASSGIGRETAFVFGEEGASLGLLDIQEASRAPEETPSTADVLAARQVPYVSRVADVSDEAQVEEAVAAILERFGRIDGLINNAGIFIRNTVADTPRDEWDRVLAVNLTGYYLMMKAVIPHLVAQGGGKIVNISSVHGLVGPQAGASYAASKGAVINLSKAAAVDLARHHINVNALCPGTIITAMSKPFRDDPVLMEEYRRRTLWPRLGLPRDVALAALFLAGPESDFVTGHALVVDGGWTSA